MAAPTVRCSNLLHIVYPPLVYPESLHPANRELQIELTVTLQLRRRRRHYSTNQFIVFDEPAPLSRQETIRFGLSVLRSYDRAFQVVSPLLVRLGIAPNRAIIDDIIRQGLSSGSSVLNVGLRALPLMVEVWGTEEEDVPADDEDRGLIEMAVEESASEYERSNFNMVPAKKSSIEEMLQRVRMETEELKAENCVICLEELKADSDASRMPCCHTFHGDCIEKWLKQSHFCPVCRFEMPTE